MDLSADMLAKLGDILATSNFFSHCSTTLPSLAKAFEDALLKRKMK